MTTCKNCNHRFDGNFCNNCGQKADTHQLNFHFLLHDLQHGILHFDKGIFFTIKEIFTRPGHAIREYIEGKRVKHFKPVSLVIILAGLYGFLTHYFHISSLVIEGGTTNQSNSLLKKFYELAGSHYFLIELLYLPLFSFASWLAFKNSKYNFVEHFILNSFITAQKLIAGIVLFPLLYIYDGTWKVAIVNGVESTLTILFVIWTYSQFFNKDKRRIVIKKTFLTFFYVLIEMVLISIITTYAIKL